MPLQDAPRVGRARGGSSFRSDQAVEGLRRIQKTSELVAMQIVEDIVAQGLAPGDRLPLEAAMVTQYRVSRASLREALRLLEVQGLISLRPGRGGGPAVGRVEPGYLARTATLFFHLAGTTYEELFLAHLELEVEAAAMAARNPDRELVRELLSPYVGDVRPTDDRSYESHWREFHRAVLDASGNRVVELLTNALSHIVRTHVLATMEPVHMREEIVAEHGQLARAIIAGNVARAMDLTDRHLRTQLDFYRRQWADHLRRPIDWR
ncbi:MAG: FCD domain-containing protein [Ilumatobacteraceae bacterium]